MLDSILSLSTAGLTVPEFIFCTVFSIFEKFYFDINIAANHRSDSDYVG